MLNADKFLHQKYYQIRPANACRYEISFKFGWLVKLGSIANTSYLHKFSGNRKSGGFAQIIRIWLVGPIPYRRLSQQVPKAFLTSLSKFGLTICPSPLFTVFTIFSFISNRKPEVRSKRSTRHCCHRSIKLAYQQTPASLLHFGYWDIIGKDCRFVKFMLTWR